MKSVLITGASKGIGLALAKALLLKDNFIIGTSRNAKTIEIDHSNFRAVDLDLNEFTNNSHYAEEFVKGCGNIDILILNAGFGRFGSIEEFSLAQIDELISVNLTAQIKLVRLFIKQFKHRQTGHIIFIGSESALNGSRLGALYCACKFAIRGFTQVLRKEVANSNIRVGLINPGMVDTNFFDKLNFAPDDNELSSIRPEQISEVINLMIESDNNIVWDEINLTPLKKQIIKKPRKGK